MIYHDNNRITLQELRRFNQEERLRREQRRNALSAFLAIIAAVVVYVAFLMLVGERGPL